MQQTRTRALQGLPVIILTAALFLPLPSVADPVPFRAVYKARFKGFPIGATGIRELKKTEDGQYILSSSARNFLASITEQTRFKLDNNDSIVPLEYQYHRKGVGKNRTAILTFDWDNMKVLNNVQSKPWKMTIPAGTQDKLSYQQKLRDDLAAAYENATEWPELSYSIADGGELKEYSFRVIGEETIATPIGHFETIKATRVHGNRERVSNFWLAPEYGFLLIRFEQTEPDGGGFELMLREAEFDGKTLVKN